MEPILIAGAGLLAIALLVLFFWHRERSEKDHRAYLAKLSVYKENGGACYKALRNEATQEEREAWQRQEETNKKALALAGLTCLRAGTYVYFD